MELFENTERELTQRLRDSCDECGREMDLKKTSKILQDLANLHSKRVPDRSSFLRASVLYKASLIRASSADAKSVVMDMKRLDARILESACARDLGHDLHGIAQEIFHQHFSNLRKMPLSSLPEQNCDRYVGKIRDIVSSLTECYLEITKAVSEKCREILGPPPCKFSHIVIGSLPLEQVSTFSAIDSALVLDNDAKRQPDFEKTINYFHWYSVIFRILFVYFGETPVDCMNISNMGTWFTDFATPRGLTFDINSEFSRISLNSAEDFSDSGLIATIDDVLDILTHSIGKNEHFAMVSSLLATRFIAGSEGLQRKFQKRVRKVVNSNQEQRDIFINSVLGHLRKVIETFSLIRIVSKENKQPNFECIVSQFITAVGFLARSENHVTSEVIKFLQSEFHLDERTTSRLELAVAIESEIRIRSDAKKFSPRGDSEIHLQASESTEGFPERRNITEYLGILSDVRSTVIELVDSGGDLNCLKSGQLQIEDSSASAEIFVYYGLYEEALSVTECHRYEDYPASYNARIPFLRGVCFARMDRLDDSNENLSVSLAMLISLPEVDQTKIIHFARYLIGKNMLQEKRLTEARENLFHAIDTLESSVYIDSTEGKELHIAILSAIGNLEYQQGEFESALLALERLHSEITRLPAPNKVVLIDAFIASANCLFKLGRYDLCVQKLENAIQIYNRAFQGQPNFLSAIIQGAMLTLGICYSKLGRMNEAEKYLDSALQETSVEQNQFSVAHAKLAVSQSNLQQKKYSKASENAFGALQEVFVRTYPKEDKLGITQASVSVILRCMNGPAMESIGNTGQELDKDSLKDTVKYASRIFDVLCEQKLFENTEVERDKSALVRAIQKGLYRLGSYDILQKIANDDINFPSVLNGILEITMSSEKIREHCENDQEYLCRISRHCNVRDSFSLEGAMIVMSGCVLRSHKLHGVLSDDLCSLQKWLSDQNNQVNTVVLHCAVKVAKHFLNSSTASRKELALEFVETIQYLLASQSKLSRALQQEATAMLKIGADCWIKEEDYEKALSLLNSALEFQERLSSDAPQISFVGSDPIIEKVGICLAKLGRWHEADNYLNRESAMKETRRKSIANEEYSQLQVNIKSATRSFHFGNYPDAALIASETFHIGLGSDLDHRLRDSMKDSVNLVLKCALAVSVKSRSQPPPFAPDVVRNVMDCAVTLRTTLKDHAEYLGGAFAELLESLYYACGKCHYAVEEFEMALKCFRKSRRMLKRKGNFPAVEAPILLNIAKSQMALGKFKKAVTTLQDLLEKKMKNGGGVHMHADAHSLLGVAYCRLHLFRLCYQHLCMALVLSISSESDVMLENISQIFCEYTLKILQISLLDPNLD